MKTKSTYTCMSCGRKHELDAKAAAVSTDCNSCVDHAHLVFMSKPHVRKMGLSCVKGCPCAAKVKV